MIKVFTIIREFESAKRLGFETYTFLPSSYAHDFDNDIIIRFGNGSSLYGKKGKQIISTEFKNVINPAKAICLNVQKHKALKEFRKVVLTPSIFEKIVPKNELVVVRPINHTEGLGFSVCRGFLKIPPNHYASKWIKTNTEFRAWFINNQVIIAKRYTTNKNRLAEKYPCRSKWLYRIYKKCPNKLKEQVLKGANQLGLEFGCADILFKNKKYFFCEFNTSPSLDDSKGILAKFYRTNLLKLAKKKFNYSIEKKMEKITFK